MARCKTNSYSNDPRWITAKFGNCKEGGCQLTGKQAFYYPISKECFCEKCGEKHSNDFNGAKFDECVYNNSF